MQIGILLFDRVEELDFVGPYEILAAAEDRRPEDIQVKTYALDQLEVTCNKRMKVVAHALCADAPQLDVMLVPGGNGSRLAAENGEMIAWIQKQAAGAKWVTSVCTGARILQAAGLIDGKRITTFHDAIPELRAAGRAADVLDDVRYVQDGNLVTSAGVSAGIDMTLWLLGQLTSPAFAREVQAYVEYFPSPPYSADVNQAA
ncbi:DJ-1/PfpI family protein [Denitrobaculum tricleocarpae]|uniref:DJ-1/PfpI family protein n=1 Tax=Denitrobaculum tricleocarpae TaxID=2591009 RepID=A0A545TWU2_9PROT|nr:DJ-1/PfpI family protein [Denitrobaculum tricleocarpae]TQV81685.1 DJ-1/PfpI family protein [Denitrobaculum tricleocarpae]